MLRNAMQAGKILTPRTYQLTYAIILFIMPLRERLVDFAVPQRSFKKDLNTEIEACLEFFTDRFTDPLLVKGIGVTVGRLGKSGRAHQLLAVAKREPRGYFWEKDGIRHVVGQEVMTRKQKDELVGKIHHITFPYAEFTGRLPAKL
jgi:hypothetical protein